MNNQSQYLRAIEFKIMNVVTRSYHYSKSIVEHWISGLGSRDLKRYHKIILTYLYELEKLIDPMEFASIASWIRSLTIPSKLIHHRLEEDHFYLPMVTPDPPYDLSEWVTRKSVISYTHNCIKRFINQETQSTLAFPAGSRLDKLCKAFDLNPRQSNILGFIFLINSKDYFKNELGNLEESINWLATMYSAVFQEPAYLFQKEISYDGKLAACGLLQEFQFDGGPFRHYSLIDAGIVYYLQGYKKHFYPSALMTQIEKGRFPLESFPLTATQLQLARSIMENPKTSGNMLISGPAGAGKTEFVKSLLGSDQKALLFKAENETKQYYFLQLSANQASKTGQVLIIDEAETFLQTQKIMNFFEPDVLKNKKLLHDFLDTYTGKLVCIVNDVDQIHESTLRRFHQIIQMPAPDTLRRKTMWMDLAKKTNLALSKAFLEQISKNYQVTPAIIQRALDSAKLAPKPLKEQMILESLNSFLSIQGKAPKTNHRGTPKDPMLIRTDIPVENLTSILEPWKQPHQRFGASLLFWGLPGTGKTEFAHTIAEALSLECRVVPSSDILDPYVGMSERRLAMIFQRAKEKNEILVIDEVDSFLYQRNQQQHSWERTLVNEFLSQLEHHPGITICTTNLLTLLDDAALRRFSWKVEFKPLDYERITKAMQLYFPQFAVELICLLDGLTTLPELTLGDFATVYKTIHPRMQANITVQCQDVFNLLMLEPTYREKKRDREILGFRGA